MAKDNSTATKVVNEVQNTFDVINSQLEAVTAICNAVEILTSLERSPEHQDTHPSHNIRTGAGYAHGLRVYGDTMPILMRHAKMLVDMSINDFDCMRESVINHLQEVTA